MSQNKITIGIVLLVLIGYIGMSLVMPISANAEATLPIEERGVKNVILLIGDGMSFAQVTAARIYEVRRDGDLNMDTLDYTGYMSTHSLNSLVTDSAAAGTALATGEKTNNDIISQSPDGEEYKTILEVAKENGKAVGLVSTAQITDATPAAFGAHSYSRKNWDDISKDYLYQTQPDLLLGGGLRYWLDNTKPGSNRTVKELLEQKLTLREAKADDGLIDDAETQGYTVVYNQSELYALDMGAEDKVLGLFSLDHMSHEFERRGTEEPHIAHMTQKALEFLKKDPDGFFLMVEGAKIDHAGHQNNITLNVHDTIAFDRAVGVALEFVEEHPDTLVIVTADHECGGLSVEWPRGSFPAKGEYIKDQDNESCYGYGIGTSNWHTAVDVPVMASGPFANHLTGRLDNTEIFGIMEKALTYQNLIAIIGYIIGFVVAAFLMFFMFKKIKRETVKINAHRKVYIMSILGFVCLITFLFAILVLSLKPLWPEKWPEAAQATLAAAITAGIVSILGIYLKFIFDQISNETAYSQKISENMMSKLHTYAEDYYLPLTNYANFSAYQLKKILTKAKASTEEKQLALFSIAKYFRYGLRLSIEKGGIVFLKKFDSELYLKKLHRSAIWNLELNTNQICRLQKSIDLEEETFLDFSKKIQCDSELMQIYETFEKWLKNNSNLTFGDNN